MTAAEFTELLFMGNALLGQYSMDFTSIVFAYVVAGHFVGPKLTRFQFIALTVVYSAFSAGIAVGVMTSISEIAFLRDQFVQQHPIQAPPLMASAVVARTFAVPPILFFCAWAISVWYVASSRRPAARHDPPADSA